MWNVTPRVGATYGYIGIMENKMETTDNGLYRDYKHKACQSLQD